MFWVSACVVHVCVCVVCVFVKSLLILSNIAITILIKYLSTLKCSLPAD